MGNNAAAGHVINFTGVAQAAGFHKTCGQMMYQYGITPWEPKALIQESLQRQQQLQMTSPLRFVQVEDGLRFYASQLGGVLNILNREKFVQMSMQLFQQRGLQMPAEEARQFYDIFDSIDLYKNAQLSLGELAGGLSSFFGGTVEAKINALFELLSQGRGQILKSTLQELLKPYVWCMVPPNAEVLRPILLPHVTEEIYMDMSFGNTGFINKQELQRWSQKGLLSQGHANPNQANMSMAIVDRVSIIMSIALQTAWREYEEKYKLQEYSQQTWQQNYGNQPQQLRDVGAYRYAKQSAPVVQSSVASVLPSQTTVMTGFGNFFQTVGQGINDLTDAFGGTRSIGMGTRRYSVDSLSGTNTYTVPTSPKAAVAAAPVFSAPAPAVAAAPAFSAPAPAASSVALPQRAPAAPAAGGYAAGGYPSLAQPPSAYSVNPYLQPPSLLSKPAYATSPGFRR